MKIYNLCDDNDSWQLIKDGYNRHSSPTECRKRFKYFYVILKDDCLLHHKLDGPALYHTQAGVSYYINGYWIGKNTYWNHPDVLAYKYLQEHPELKGFL